MLFAHYLITIYLWGYVDGLVQGSSNSIANELELLQACAKPSMWHIYMYMPLPEMLQ